MKRSICILILIVIMLSSGCGNKNVESNNIPVPKAPEISKESDINLNIITTDKVLYYMVKDIVGNKHNVDYMFKDREDELIFSFTDDSLNNISKQDLFIYMGAGFEPWTNKFFEKLNKNRVGIINVSRGVKLQQFTHEIKFKDIVMKDNPYYYFNLDNYKILLSNIKNAVEDKDPKNRDYYEKNFSDILKVIDNYTKGIKEISESLNDYLIVVDEDEMDYFLKYAGIKFVKLNTDDKGVTLFAANKDESDKFASKLEESKNKIFLYTDDALLRKNANLVSKYSMKVVNLKIYSDNIKFTDILTNDIDILKKLSK